MKTVGIFYQREGSRDVEHIEIQATQTIADLKQALQEKHGGDGAAALFVEDRDDRLGEETTIEAIAGPRGAKVHIHRCPRITVSVHFGAKTFERAFGPGSTIATIKRWAAETEVGMSADDASEHVLQLAGATERPSPKAHVGTLAACAKCSVSFDLVPEQRVNG